MFALNIEQQRVETHGNTSLFLHPTHKDNTKSRGLYTVIKMILPIWVQWMIVAILYIIAYEYSIHFAIKLNECNTQQCKKLKGIHESCMLCIPPKIGHLRGQDYYIGAMSEKKHEMLDHCLVTFWSFAHFTLYSLIGLLAPNLFWETFGAGVAFEFYEKYAFDCHDVFDVLENTLGFWTGRLIGHVTGFHNKSSSE